MIAIVVPYRSGEPAKAAVRLANLIEAKGDDAVIVSPVPPRRAKIHGAWDNRVLAIGKTKGKATAALAKARTTVHFGTLPTVALPPDRCVLVPTIYPGTARPCRDAFKAYRVIVAGSRGQATALGDLYSDAQKRSGLLAECPWSTDVAPLARSRELTDGKLQAVVYCDVATVDYCAAFVQQLVDDLLASYEPLGVTLVSEKSWSRQERDQIRRRLRDYPGRFLSRRLGVEGDWRSVFRACDWAVFPGVCGLFGLAASTAIACGAPVIANDVSPFSDQVTHGVNGLLVACDVRSHGLHSPLAVPHAGHWADVCREAFTSTQTLYAIQSKPWKTDQRQKAFDAFWSLLLELES